MNRNILILLLPIVTVAASCSNHEEPTKKVAPEIQWSLAIRTIEARQDTIGDEIGICISNDALSYTLDTATVQELTRNRYAIHDHNGDEPSVWVLEGQNVTHTPVQCGGSNGKITLITNGLEGGESVITSINISSPNNQH